MLLDKCCKTLPELFDLSQIDITSRHDRKILGNIKSLEHCQNYQLSSPVQSLLKKFKQSLKAPVKTVILVNARKFRRSSKFSCNNFSGAGLARQETRRQALTRYLKTGNDGSGTNDLPSAKDDPTTWRTWDST